MKWSRDPAAWFFAVCGLLTLAVSLPATFALLRPFHDTGDWPGAALAGFATAVFEIGAVGAKLITLAVPQWNKRLTALTLVLLVLTTIGNWLAGVELFRAATLPPTLAEWRRAGAGPYLAGIAAALFPALLFVWLTALTARVKHLASEAQAAASTRPAEYRRLARALIREVRRLRIEATQAQPATPHAQPALALVDSVRYLRDVEGLTFPEIGKRLGISRQAAQQRYKKEAA